MIKYKKSSKKIIKFKGKENKKLKISNIKLYLIKN